MALESFKAVTEIQPCRLKMEVAVSDASRGGSVVVTVSDRKTGGVLSRAEEAVRNGKASFSMACPQAQPWSPDQPNLYDLKLELRASGRLIDAVKSYTGFREISMAGGKLMLNRNPVWLIGALDQGYYPDGLYSAPSDSVIEQDVR